LIEQYRGDPLPVSQPGRTGAADDTFGSAPEPISQPPAPSAAQTKPDGDHRRGVLIGVGVAFSSMVLVAAGIALGTYLGSSRAATAENSPSPHASASPSATAPTLPSGPAGPGAFTQAPTAGPGKPKIVMSQKQGDPLSSFVIEGRHWPPGSLVIIALAGVRHSQVQDFADGVGAFNYVINQGHRLFGDGIPI